MKSLYELADLLFSPETIEKRERDGGAKFLPAALMSAVESSARSNTSLAHHPSLMFADRYSNGKVVLRVVDNGANGPKKTF